MAIVEEVDYYGTLAEAIAYFTDRLHEVDFLGSSSLKQNQALFAARKQIDALRFAGFKKPVYDLIQSKAGQGTDPTQAEIDAADATQPLQFPRDTQTAVPQAIKLAQWELAHELLRGRDPGIEKENLVLTSEGAGSTRASKDTSSPPDHIASGIVSWSAWVNLLPYLADNNTFTVKRTS